MCQVQLQLSIISHLKGSWGFDAQTYLSEVHPGESRSSADIAARVQKKTDMRAKLAWPRLGDVREAFWVGLGMNQFMKLKRKLNSVIGVRINP